MSDHELRPPQEIIAITGGAGQIAQLLRPRLARPNRTLRLLDIRHIDAPPDGETVEVHQASITDPDHLDTLFKGVRAIVHLAAQSYESDLDDILDTNVRDTYSVLEAARRAGVPKVVLASSHHAAGFHPVPNTGAEMPADLAGRPDTLYGWSKVATEALGRLYADRFAMDIICLRIGSCTPTPVDQRSLALWLSPDDAARLVEASIQTTSPGYHMIWGISRNATRSLSLAAGEAIGYVPINDAERYAADVANGHATSDQSRATEPQRIGGPWCTTPLARSNRPPVDTRNTRRTARTFDLPHEARPARPG